MCHASLGSEDLFVEIRMWPSESCFLKKYKDPLWGGENVVRCVVPSSKGEGFRQISLEQSFLVTYQWIFFSLFKG